MSFKKRWHRKKALKAARNAENGDAGAIAVAIAWYTRAQWQELTRIVPDRSELDDSYEQWQQSAREAVELMRSKGMAPIPIHVKIGDLLAWCEEQGCQPDGAARAQYTRALLRGLLAGKGDY